MFFALATAKTCVLTAAVSLKDDDLAGKVGLQAKELNKLMATLSNDKLVQMYVSAPICFYTPLCVVPRPNVLYLSF